MCLPFHSKFKYSMRGKFIFDHAPRLALRESNLKLEIISKIPIQQFHKLPTSNLAGVQGSIP